MPLLHEPSVSEMLGWAVIAAGLAYGALFRRGEGPAIAAAVLCGSVVKVALFTAV